jgi:putative ABC transport system permease protein
MLLLIAWRNLRSRPLQHGLTLLVAALAAGLAVATLLALQVVEDGTTRSSQPFEMLVGVKGSPTQLALNTIFLQDTPLGNLEHRFLTGLQRDERVQAAVPLGFGDNYRGFRLVGTTPELFSLLRPRADAAPVLRLAQGRLFAQPFEVVAGAQAAKRLGLAPGDSFVSAHGAQETAEAEEHEDRPYRVVGVLAASGTAYDRGLFTGIESLWEAHEQAEEGRGVTAILVRPRTLGDLMRIYQEINTGTEAQAIFPGQVMAGLYRVLGQGQQVLGLLSLVVVVMTSLTTAISLYWATVERRREISVLRAIGVSPGAVVSLTVLQAALIAAGGILLGGLLGYAAAHGLAWYLHETAALSARPAMRWQETAVMASLLLLSTAAGLIPALQAYRVQPGEGQTM